MKKGDWLYFEIQEANTILTSEFFGEITDM
jgi:hypothetical protein